MSVRSVCSVLLLASLLAACSDGGPQVPILFVSPPTGSNGAGHVTSSPAGIDCNVSNQASSGTCSANFEDGTEVTLSASAADGSGFAEWGGACSGAVNTCALTLDQSRDVTAHFALANPQALTVEPTGNSGSGTITSNPGGLNCIFNGETVSGTCTADFADGAVVTLTATPVVGSGFVGWGADCAGSAAAASCPLTMSAARSASGTFVSVAFSGLVAATSGTESGLIIVNIPTASARVAATNRPGVSASVAQAGLVLAVGTFRYLGGTATQVAGFYDTDSKVLSIASGNGFQSSVNFTGGSFDGFYSDTSTGLAGPISLVTASGAAAPTIFCGTFTVPDPSGGGGSLDDGAWSVVVSDTLVTGIKNSQFGFETLGGSLRGSDMNLIVRDNVLPDASDIGTATGTLSTDRTSLTGDFNDGTFIGTWTASTTCQ